MATITVSRPNFLASEEGLVLKSASADAVTNSALVTDEADADGLTHKTLKAGTLFSSVDVKGIVYQDVDLSGSTADKKVPIPVMVAGYYIAGKLPVAPANAGSSGTPAATSPSLDECKAQNLIAVNWVNGTVTRPNALEDF